MNNIKLIFLLIILSLFSNCKKEKPTSPNEVFITNSTFDPSLITITSGTKITWSNKEDLRHTVTCDSLIFNSGDMDKSKTFSYTFNSVGTYPYRCIYHNDMKGKVIVQ